LRSQSAATPSPIPSNLSQNGGHGIAIDEAAGLVCFIRSIGGTSAHTVVAAKDILSSEVSEDGETVTRSVRSSQVAGALVGGVLLGGAGVLIGALSGKKRTQSKVSAITLRVTVNDTRDPLQEVTFLSTEASRGGVLYKNASALALRWQALIDILMKRADGSIATPATIAPQLTPKIERQLKILTDMRAAGVLNEEQFAEQRTKLLARHG
jgi:hypothetical protein